jgi:hypothetical protein
MKEEGCVAMSNLDWEDDDFDTEEVETPRQDSGDNLVKQLRKAQREADRKAKALEAELTEYRNERRVNSIKSVLTERGLNPKVAELIPADVESNPEAVSVWLDKYGEVFGLPPRETNTPDTSALRQIEQVTGSAQIPVGEDEVFLRLSQAGSAEEIINMIHSSIK